MNSEIFYKRLGIALILLSLIFFTGILGFIIIEDYSIFDAFYETIVIFSTVGLSLVQPLSSIGRIFVSILIICNICIYTYAISIVTAYFIDRNLSKSLKKNKVEKLLANISSHVIICGDKNLVTEVVSKIKNESNFIVIVNENHENNFIDMDNVKNQNKLITINKKIDEDLLTNINVNTAKVFLTLYKKDNLNIDNIFLVKKLNNNIKVVSVADNLNSESKLKKMGSDEVMNLSIIGANYISSLV